MKLKHIILLLLAFPVIAFSCIEDLGNYDYLPPEAIMDLTITFPDHGDTIIVAPGELLEIEPVIGNMDSETEYAYSWYAMSEVYTGGATSNRYDLGTEKNLSTEAKMPLGVYMNLYLKVTDLKRDLFTLKHIKVMVIATDITTGWYILKEMNGKTDFDYIKLDKSEMFADVLQYRAGVEEYVNGPAIAGDMQLEGKPVKIYYQSGGYAHESKVMDADGEIKSKVESGLSALHILSDRDIKTFNPNTLYLFKDYENQFYEAPAREVKNGSVYSIAGEVSYFNKQSFLLIAGKIYAMGLLDASSSPAHSGIYPGFLSSTFSPNYVLHNDIAQYNAGTLVFDTTTKSFLTTGEGVRLAKFVEPTTQGLPSLSNMDYDLVFMRSKNQGYVESMGNAMYPQIAYCLMKSLTDGKYHLIRLSGSVANQALYPLSYIREVPANSKMPEADVFHTLRAGSYIYYGKDNVLSRYEDTDATDNRDTVLKTFGADEKIVHMDDPLNSSYDTYPHPLYMPEYYDLYVLTNSPSGWKLYSYPVRSADNFIDFSKEEVIGEGEGVAHYMMKRVL